MSTQPDVFRTGDRALHRFGTSDVPVEVLEELGAVGFKGKRMVRVLMFLAEAEPVDIVLHEADLRRPSAA